MKEEEIKKAVKDRYREIAVNESSCCAPATRCCGSTQQVLDVEADISRRIGYSERELHSVPERVNLGLGCGNPTARASLKEGETVLDLGCGAGFDAFLASRKVGDKGKVIGVDMTPEMIAKARKNAAKGNRQNVGFRQGAIEALPVVDDSVDVVISNCVINLAPDKRKVFKEAFRVLKRGGRLMVSDIVSLKELPTSLKTSVAALTGCLAGALPKGDYLEAIRAAGFKDVQIIEQAVYPVPENRGTGKELGEELQVPVGFANQAADDYVSSIMVYGVKPD